VSIFGGAAPSQKTGFFKVAPFAPKKPPPLSSMNPSLLFTETAISVFGAWSFAILSSFPPHTAAFSAPAKASPLAPGIVWLFSPQNEL